MNLYVFSWSGNWSADQVILMDSTEESARARADADLRTASSGLTLRLEEVLPAATGVVIVTTEQTP